MGTYAWLKLGLMVAAAAVVVGFGWLLLSFFFALHGYVEGLPIR